MAFFLMHISIFIIFFNHTLILTVKKIKKKKLKKAWRFIFGSVKVYPNQDFKNRSTVKVDGKKKSQDVFNIS